ncbi:hypothetical protein C8F04DRAFT_1190409 [Mycena alexandri]|uniref:Uncharacterized protein n=1 Tax=Mycena alexandri TaxID=1745969 RepID=A0AAD6SFJ3_9AGAR|nr:hypothetical protein C8F04DRAFT_1190409 [Mycena alexandri]
MSSPSSTVQDTSVASSGGSVIANFDLANLPVVLTAEDQQLNPGDPRDVRIFRMMQRIASAPTASARLRDRRLLQQALLSRRAGGAANNNGGPVNPPAQTQIAPPTGGVRPDSPATESNSSSDSDADDADDEMAEHREEMAAVERAWEGVLAIRDTARRQLERLVELEGQLIDYQTMATALITGAPFFDVPTTDDADADADDEQDPIERATHRLLLPTRNQESQQDA